MRAILLEQPRQFRAVDLPEPTSPGPGQALVRVHRVGVCGTDISGYLGKMPLMRYPRILGHELGVEVVALGEGVRNVAVGDRCAVEPYLNCGRCSPCRRGHSNCCENLEVLGVHIDGGLRPRFLVPAAKLHPSRTLTLEQLALVETLGIGCHAVDRGRVQAGEPVLIIGAGPIGLAVLEFARLAGANLAVLDVNERRLRFCREALGVAKTIQGRGEGDSDRVREVLGESPHCVFDATGNAVAMRQAFHHVGFAGRLVFVGIVPEEIAFPDPLLHRREMTVMGSRNALPADFQRILALIEAGRIDTRPWITHHSSLATLLDDFPTFCDPKTGVVKAMVAVE
jgi:alcohol dehydrogenase